MAIHLNLLPSGAIPRSSRYSKLSLVDMHALGQPHQFQMNYAPSPASEKILDILRSGYLALFNAAKHRGHWDEVRSTSLATICLDFREASDSLWLQTLHSWLIARQSSEGSWGEEVWDTAMAVYALKSLGVSSREPTITSALAWLGSVHTHTGRGNWHDEPWETSWALIAILRCGTVPKDVDVAKSIRWLASLQSKETGQIVSPHYTAYFLLIAEYSKKVDLPATFRVEIGNIAARCRTFLMESLRNAPASHLWMNEAWANGQIVWALCEENDELAKNEFLVAKIIAWFGQQQKRDGSFEDVEDTSSAIIGLLQLQLNLVQIHESNGNKREALRLVQAWLQRCVPVPRMNVKRPFFHRDPEADYYTFNIRTIYAKVLIFVFVALVGWLSSVMGLWQAARDLWTSK